MVEHPVIAFTSASAFRDWLELNHATHTGLWMKISKKDSVIASISYAEALDEALCFGWIDGQKKPFDKLCWLQKFTPRRSKSAWSKINTQHVERLIKAGAMTPAGIKAVEAAKAEGRWETAYVASKSAIPPQDFLQELSKNKKAEAFFKTLNKTNAYSVVYRLETAKKSETRTKRMKMILAMMEQGQTFHP